MNVSLLPSLYLSLSYKLSIVSHNVEIMGEFQWRKSQACAIHALRSESKRYWPSYVRVVPWPHSYRIELIWLRAMRIWFRDSCT